METLKRSILSFTAANLVNKGILYFLITAGSYLEGGEGEVSLALSWNLEESTLILRKGVLILVIYGLNFSLFGLLFLRFWWNVYQSAIIPRKLPCADKFLVRRLHHNDLSADCSTKESIRKFLKRAIQKIHENTKCLES